MGIVIQSLFGRAAEDIRHYAENGHPFAILLNDFDALDVAINTATEYHNLVGEELVYSPPYTHAQCQGYIVFKDESIAEIIYREMRDLGIACSLAKHGKPAFLPG